MGRAPTAPELDRLLDEAVREEILYREAQRLALDRDDPIVRRRLAQKMTFLLEDRVEAAAPTPGEIRAHYAAHADRYREPRRTTFRHVFLSPARRADAERDAERLLDVLGATAGGGGWRRLGDPFMLLGEYADRTDRELAVLFGEPFAAALGELAVGEWRGPVRSAHGVHVVRVLGRRETTLPGLAAVRERVAADLVEVRAREQNEAAFEALRARYEVRFPAPGSAREERRRESAP
ncbi:MAG: peptidylprolyl isomerase [Acidobacteria bacterium]|nr:peptidylprolyl isomerase [Acidobacteriota bacterium]